MRVTLSPGGIMQVSEVMHQGVTTVQINDSLKHAAAIMKKKNLGSLPVYKNERPVGFVTDRDIVITCVANGTSPDETVSLAMSKEIFSIKRNQDITEAANLMKQKQISRLLVVDDGEQPVGMLSLHDLVRTDLHSDVMSQIKRL